MNHIQKIARHLREHNLDALLITGESIEWYAFGFHGEGVGLITPHQAWYFTDSRYLEAAREQVELAQVLQHSLKAPAGVQIQALCEQEKLQAIGFEEEAISLSAYRRWEERLKGRLKPASALLSSLRAGKDEQELQCMLRAQRTAERAFSLALPSLKPGITEQAFAALLEYHMRCCGAEKMSFDTIVASGPNGSRPHAVPGGREIARGDFVTIDFGCVVEGYCSDTTRTVAVGTPTAEMEQVYSIVLQAQLTGIAKARAGLTGKEIDAAARQVIDAAGYGPYFGHSFGHSVGIDIHESPNFSPGEEKTMPRGAVVSAEPGIYLPGRFGVRIEDVVVLEETGCTVLTKLPKELIVL